MISYREALAQGMFRLMQQKIPDAGLDARLLLEYVCNTDQNYLYLHGDVELTNQQEESYEQLLRRRESREPLQYITGQQIFMGYPFQVREGVLIPRQETELLVELLEQLLLPKMSVLDVCTGSGCILISLLRRYREKNPDKEPLRAVGTDISGEALIIAKENAVRNGVQADFIETDLFPGGEEKFDIIVSNPPYIVSKVVPELMPEVREYEPKLALDGGADGLDFYRRIIKQAPAYMKEKSVLCFEIGYDQGKAVSSLMKEEGFVNVRVIKDYADLDRIVVGFL